MSHALTYLWFALLKRQVLRFCRGLRRPTNLVGLVAVLSLVGFLFHHRHHDVFAQLVRRESVVGGMLIMLGGSLFKGFLQRGMAFDPPDIEFLFTSPFTPRQIISYRLLPNYLFAAMQGLVFFALFESHLNHPLVTTVCFILFQIACFHLATAAAIFAGTISEQSHYRIRCVLLGVYFLVTAVYLRSAWEIKIIPAVVSSPVTQLLFYPSVTLSDVGKAPFVYEWTVSLIRTGTLSTHALWQSALYIGSFAAGAIASLWLLLKFKVNVFETSLPATTRRAEKRLRVQQGRRVVVVETATLRSARLPRLALFQGVGAIVWKNLIVARRSRRELTLAFVFTLIFTLPLIALLWYVSRNLMSQTVDDSTRRLVEDFTKGVALFLASLAFLLQWTLPFDFRRDGHHLMGFRTLPVSPIALALAEITVPTAFCLVFQSLGVVMLMIYGRFGWSTMLVMLLAYPAVALALNAVWNLHYLLSATRRAGGRSESASPVGTLMVVALSFMIFFPAGWTGVQVGNHFVELGKKPGVAFAVAAALTVQYLVDFLVIVALSKLFQRFEVSRDFQ